jgi:DNA-binding IclR family transcriptional regulator
MSTSVVKSADRALAVLQALAVAGRPQSTQALALACDMPKSSAHHLLNVMRNRGFVSYRENERAWSLGAAVIEVAAAYRRSDPLQIEGGAVLADLTRQLGHTAHLAVLRGTEVLYIDKRDASSAGVKLVTEIGSRLPACATAVGQAILAFLPAGSVDELFDSYRFPAVTDGEPNDLGQLREQLAEVARRGFAHDVGMISSGISCVAAPVFDRENAPIASIGVTFVTAQASPESLQHIIAIVRVAAAQLSAAIGSGAPAPLAGGRA